MADELQNFTVPADPVTDDIGAPVGLRLWCLDCAEQERAVARVFDEMRTETTREHVRETVMKRILESC